MNSSDPILVTGAAGFIGFHVACRLARDGRAVIGIDNLNSYYDPALKKARLAELSALPSFQFQQLDIADRDNVAALFATHRFPAVIHLAAQVGVLYSLRDPHAYADANLTGFLNILGPGRIKWVHPDCGFWMNKRSIADRKMESLVKGRDRFLGINQGDRI